MLEWKMVGDVWLGNGFRIEHRAPSRWNLHEAAGETDGGVATTSLLAELPTLQACQFEAERLHVEQATSTARHRLALVGVGAWGLAIIGGSPVAFVLGSVVGTAAILELGTTWIEGRTGGARDHMQ